MSKQHTRYVCQSCGYESPRWAGKCPTCGVWNAFAEEIVAKKSGHKTHMKGTSVEPVPLDDVDISDDRRLVSGMEEFDRVLGGGIVRGSVVLLGGDPGVGKSTLMLQLADKFPGRTVLYVSGEESARQIRLRADRLGIGDNPGLLVLAETNAEVVVDIMNTSPPDLVIIDSIQTAYRPALESAPGSVGQVRESTALFLRAAKMSAIPVFLIGHVTKEGLIAGPRAIEHMVDTVLQFEGEQQHAYRILRTIKNRFGSTNEIGVFEMRLDGLQEVTNPSEVFLSGRTAGLSGSCVVASIEGTRPILVEVQALVTPTSYGVPQRNATGVDYRRIGLLLAVLEKRLGVLMGQYDVFVNVAGGVRIEEPAVDLGVALSIMSSIRDRPIDPQSVVIGEIGLGGEVRTVSQIEKRVQEALKLGFRRAVIPQGNVKGITRNGTLDIVGVDRIDEAFAHLLG